MKKLLSLLMCLAMVLSLVCSTFAEAAEETEATTEIVWDENHETIRLEMDAEYGEGAKTFTLVTNHQSQVARCTVHTDEETVGAALLALNIVAGDVGEYGLLVSTIDGYTADYSADGSYWAFYIDGEYSMTGVDSTEINEGSTYLFQVEGPELEEGTTVTLEDGKNYGLGEKRFALHVIDGEGNEIAVTVSTDQETVGAALEEWNIVAGEDGDYGLYIETVNNITADFNTDGSYWVFYIDGEYAMTGVDSTEINEDSVYTLQVTKG